MDDGESLDFGPWKKLKVLGTGGFGQVTLWYNSLTGQKITIKKLHDLAKKDPVMRAKQMDRWCKEVEIMKKLNHSNIVATLEIPSQFHILTPQPLLAMEFCTEGDLRQVLSRGENCCGLREQDVVDVLKDVSNGLEYLHSCKIIHRDLKPDNIVLQKKNSDVTYKLIDLGYAKELDQTSLCQSFVGTVQYIAPELFFGKAYTSSVDYWSFGLVVHEIISGYRPFMPGYSPTEWMKQIQNKPRNVIRVLENTNGDIISSSNITRKNHLSRCFLEDVEKWLRLALDWNGQTRGRDPEKIRPVIFEELRNILSKTVIKVFSMPTCETLSFEIIPETDISDLRRWIKQNTGLESDDQLLLLPSGKVLNKEGNLLNYFKNEKFDRNKISIFLYNCGSILMKRNAMIKPKYLDEVITNAKKSLRYRHLKRNSAESLYFLQREADRYRNLLQGIRVKINNTKQKTLAIETMYEDVGDEWKLIDNYAQFLSLSHRTDLENYIHYRKIGKLKSSQIVQKWIKNVVAVDKKINELKNFYNKSVQKQLVVVARQRCRNLDSHPGNDFAEKTPLDEIVNEGEKLWDNVLRMSRDSVMTNTGFINLINRSIDETKKLIQSQMIPSLFRKITEADENLAKFVSHLTTLLKSIKVLKELIENTQKERQEEVWDLIGNLKEVKNNEKEATVNGVDKTIPRVKKAASVDREDFISLASNNSGTEFLHSEKNKSVSRMNDSMVTCKNDFESNLWWKSPYDAQTIIQDNYFLRQRLEEVQQDCCKMMNDLCSMNWDFINQPLKK